MYFKYMFDTIKNSNYQFSGFHMCIHYFKNVPKHEMNILKKELKDTMKHCATYVYLHNIIKINVPDI